MQLEDIKEEAELKAFTLNNKISILEKELSSTTTINKDLTVSLENAKEDVNLMTEHLKRTKDELKELQTAYKQREVECFNIKQKCEQLSATLNRKEEELQSAKLELSNIKEVCVVCCVNFTDY